MLAMAAAAMKGQRRLPNLDVSNLTHRPEVPRKPPKKSRPRRRLSEKIRESSLGQDNTREDSHSQLEGRIQSACTNLNYLLSSDAALRI